MGINTALNGNLPTSSCMCLYNTRWVSISTDRAGYMVSGGVLGSSLAGGCMGFYIRSIKTFARKYD